MLIPPNTVVIFVVALITVAGCRQDRENGIADASLELCELHGITLSKQDGYFPDPELLVDPSQDYLRFFDEKQFPHTLPWFFTRNRFEYQTQATTVSFCPKCEEEFRIAFEEFSQLPEAEKDAHEEAMIRRLIEKKKAEQDASSNH
jgi:hypothetical protein